MHGTVVEQLMTWVLGKMASFDIFQTILFCALYSSTNSALNTNEIISSITREFLEFSCILKEMGSRRKLFCTVSVHHK